MQAILKFLSIISPEPSSAKRYAAARGVPFPPTRMIRPTTLVFWNSLKGGVDEYSRAMQNLTRSNVSENAIVTIITRLLMAQVCNAAVAHRLVKSRQTSVLPPTLVESCAPSSRSN